MLFLINNFANPTTAAFVPVTTGTSLKTMLQVVPSATKIWRITEWGIVFSGFAAAAKIKVELIEVDVAATVTAHVAAGINKLDGEAMMCGDPTTNLIQVGTSTTGYTASAEGTITATRWLDAPLQLSPTDTFVKQFPLGEQPMIQISKYARIRVHAPAAVDAVCWMKIAG